MIRSSLKFIWEKVFSSTKNLSSAPRSFEKQLQDIHYDSQKIPMIFTCRISFEPLETPMILNGNLQFIMDERSLLEYFRRGNRTHPFTGEIIAPYVINALLKPTADNHAIRASLIVDQYYAYMQNFVDGLVLIDTLKKQQPKKLEMALRKQMLAEGFSKERVDLIERTQVLSQCIENKKMLLTTLNLFLNEVGSLILSAAEHEHIDNDEAITDIQDTLGPYYILRRETCVELIKLETQRHGFKGTVLGTLPGLSTFHHDFSIKNLNFLTFSRAVTHQEYEEKRLTPSFTKRTL